MHANNAVNQGEVKDIFMLICISRAEKEDRGRGRLKEKMNLFKQMNSNEASHTRRLESVSVVREKARTSPVERTQPKLLKGKGEKNKRTILEKVSREEEWSSNERGEPERRGPEFKVVFRLKDCPPERPNTDFLRV